ncbi:zinc finger protein [Macleaya cordata]|uniref:Zinc finger protein n=1 Tax=Macleaya cordata TaxID=56857 RepID=A0A200PU12_MACCD|nr:zinc finger protein [Macleaya cordata]
MNMAASRRLLFGTTLFRIHRNSSASPYYLSNLLPSSSPILSLSSSFTKPYPFPRFHLFKNSYSSSPAASVDELPEIGTETVDVSHPWPEWVKFIDRLKSKGYFSESSSSVEDGDGGGDAAAGIIRTDLNQLKNACLTFARERFDICKSLSREDIQTVVKYGCPSLSRKAVNSAKRLRAFVRLDEGEVCGGCNLRGSCDRAYGILKESEASARTVDIVRMLLIYALDPLVHSREKPNGREHIEASARKLLSELIELSETSPDPALPKPAVKPARKPQTIVDIEKSQNIEMKKGDWMCSKCNFMNFARNIRCLQCKEDGPKRVSVDEVEMKKGDWTCPKCTFMNFSRNKNCLRCQESRPKRQLQPGEWECPSCDFVNFRKNTVCLKCSCDRPRDEEAQYEDQMWKRPR